MLADENKKPEDMADESVLSGDGVNPVSQDMELKMAHAAHFNDIGLTAAVDFDDVGLYLPGTVPPAYFPGLSGGPSIG